MSVFENIQKLVELSDIQLLNRFISYLYENTNCRGCEYKGVEYEELPNMWGGDSEDPELMCDGYSKCEIAYERICPPDSAVKLLINVSDRINLEWLFDNESSKEFTKIVKDEIINNFSFSLDDILINEGLHIYNPCGENTDHRGSDHCKIVLPTNYSNTLHSPTTNDLLQALYRAKSHKFDSNYEMFCGVNTTVNPYQPLFIRVDTESARLNYKYSSKLSFNHGS